MYYRVGTDDVAGWGAAFLLSRQRISEERKNEIMPATKYNLLVKTFNVASILLVAAAVSALFLAISSSFVFLCIGLFLRYTSERELGKYTIPLPPRGWEAIAQVVQMHFLRHALNQTTEEEKAANIFARLNIPAVPGWKNVVFEFLDFTVLANTVDIEEVVEQLPQQGQANANNNGVQGHARGMFANLANRVMGQQPGQEE